MTSMEMFGLLDLNNTIPFQKPLGEALGCLTGHECLTTLYTLQDSSPLIAEGHQQVPHGPASLVYPNIPEGEKLVSSLAKQIAAFTSGHLGDRDMDPNVISSFLCTFVHPQLVHEASHCQWDSTSQMLLTSTELEENTTEGLLEEQGWWKDVVKQFEEKQHTLPGKRANASQQALFDLDGILSVKTMHERNEIISSINSPPGSKHVHITEEHATEIMEVDDDSGDEISPDPQEGCSSRRQGNMPKKC